MADQSTSAADDAGRGAAGGVERYVEALAVLPGAEHVAVVDLAGERVLGEWGGPPGSARAVLDRARRATEASRQGRRELEDIVSTTGSAFHLTRLVLAGPGHPESVWASVRINRARGNLTWSRGALAGLGGPAGGFFRPATAAPAGSPADSEATSEAPRTAHGDGASAQAPAVVPPPPPPPAPAVVVPSAAAVAPPAAPAAPTSAAASTSTPAPKAPAAPVSAAPKASAAPVPAAPKAPAAPVPAAPKSAVALKATVVPKGPAAPAASAGTGRSTSGTAATTSRSPATREPSTTASGTGEPSTAETLIAETAVTVEMVTPRPAVPAARTSPENAPEPSPAAPEPRSSFAPVITVPPPPSPVPDDGTCEEPAPMPAPVITAPPLASVGSGVGSGPAVGSGLDVAVEAAPSDEARPGLARRTPGVHLTPRLPGPPAVPLSRPVTSTTGATAFMDEPSVLRRLIKGLRRPT